MADIQRAAIFFVQTIIVLKNKKWNKSRGSPSGYRMHTVNKILVKMQHRNYAHYQGQVS